MRREKKKKHLYLQCLAMPCVYYECFLDVHLSIQSRCNCTTKHCLVTLTGDVCVFFFFFLLFMLCTSL